MDPLICKECGGNITQYHCANLPNIYTCSNHDILKTEKCFICSGKKDTDLKVRWRYKPDKIYSTATLRKPPALKIYPQWRWLYISACNKCADRVFEHIKPFEALDEADALNKIALHIFWSKESVLLP